MIRLTCDISDVSSPIYTLINRHENMFIKILIPMFEDLFLLSRHRIIIKNLSVQAPWGKNVKLTYNLRDKLLEFVLMTNTIRVLHSLFYS
jgi:hypothetical protein